jgi:hypothetical protein
MTCNRPADRPVNRSVPDMCRAEARELSWDLACVRGALNEIATCWRRTLSYLPELPPRLPLHLEETARAIEADVLRLVDAGPNQSAGLAVEVTGRFAAFRQDITSARAMTGALDATDAGDALLWESADHALRHAGSRLLCLILQLVTDTDWSPTSPAAPAGRAALVVSLGPVSCPS